MSRGLESGHRVVIGLFWSALSKLTALSSGQFTLSELAEEAWNWSRILPTSLTGDFTSEIAEDDWERGCKIDKRL